MAMPMTFDLRDVRHFSKVRCVEPQKRMVGGRYGRAIHRFEVKGGITPSEAIRRNMCSDLMSRNALGPAEPSRFE